MTQLPAAGRVLPPPASSPFERIPGEPYDPDRAMPLRSAALLTLPGSAASFAEAPDPSPDVVGDLDVRVFDIALADWTPATPTRHIVSKHAQAANSNGWSLRFNASGQMILAWNAGAGLLFATSAALGIADGSRICLRAVLDVNNGASGRTVTFYTAPRDGVGWTPLGSPVVQAGVTSIAANALPLRVGADTSGASGIEGTVGRVEVRNGIDGPLVASPDFTDPARVGASSFTDAQGNVWTLGAAASLDAAALPWGTTPYRPGAAA